MLCPLHGGQFKSRTGNLCHRRYKEFTCPFLSPTQVALEAYGLLLALALALPLLAFLTPAVLSLPLLLVTTAVFEGAVLPFMFGFILALVSTTPLRVALLLPVLPAEPEFVLPSPPPQALHMPAAASKQRVAIFRRIFAPY